VASLVVLAIAFQTFWVHMKAALELCIWGEPISDHSSNKSQVSEIPLKNWLPRICKMKNHNYLFIYSDTDDLIPWNQVEEIADIAASHDNYVVKKKFLGSEHVMHYRKYPKEYVELITDFIRRAMKNNSNKNRSVIWEGQ